MRHYQQSEPLCPPAGDVDIVPGELESLAAEKAELAALTPAKSVITLETSGVAGPAALVPELGFANPTGFDPYKMYDNIKLGMVQQTSFIGFNAAIAHNGILYVNKAFGFANDGGEDGGKNPKMRTGTRVHLASASKPITAVGIMRLLEMRDELTLRTDFMDVLGDRYPDADPLYREVTLEELLSHTGGVDPGGQFYCSQTTQALAQPPGPAGIYGYSNVNFCLLREFIEAASGQSFASFMQSRVFDPAGLQDFSCTYVNSERYSQRWRNGGGSAHDDQDYQTVCGAYGIYLSAVEYCRFLVFLRFGRIIDRDTSLEEMFTLRTPNYGLGFAPIEATIAGKEYFGHNGAWTVNGHGTRTAAIMTNDGVDAVLLCNTAVGASIMTILRDAYEGAFS